jgi:hypothetical protein
MFAGGAVLFPPDTFPRRTSSTRCTQTSCAVERARGSYQSHSQHADPVARQQDQYGTFESLFLISPSEPNCLGRLRLTRRGFEVLGRSGQPVPNNTQGGN